MADKDTITKEYMQDSCIFADVFNFLLYDGRQVINPGQLKPIDTTAIVLPYGEGQRSVPVQKYRDLLKMVTAMEDENAAYLLLGIENQSQIHYAMPIRNMLYDAMQYVSQVEDTAKSHRGKETTHSETGAEYLSGFYRTDRLLPIVTLTLYFGADEWTAPKDLHSMLAANNDILKFIDNYHIHLVAPADILLDDFQKFHTELRLALKYLKYSKDKKMLNEIISEDTAHQSVSRKTADMINIITGSKLNYHQGEEQVNMCIAIEEMRKDAIEFGKEQGIEQGIEQGKVLGAIKICRDLGLDSSDIIVKIIHSFSLTRDEAESYMQKALANA